MCIRDRYYDEGEGFNEKASIMCRAAFHKNKFSVDFDLPETKGPVRQLRFDPGESGMAILKKMVAFIEYLDGSREVISLEQCDSNGFAFENKVLFLGDDPQAVSYTHLFCFICACSRRLQPVPL